MDAGPLRHGNRRGRAVPANQRRCWRYDPADHHGYPCVPDDVFAHRGLTRFVLSGKNPGEDITEVVEEHFGIGAGKLITLLYFFAIYPILLVYSVAITNTVESFMSHQLGMTPPPRAILSLILIVGMMTIVRFGEQMIVKAMSILVFPFVGVLMLLALYLIRSGTALHWKRCLWTLHLQPETVCG